MSAGRMRTGEIYFTRPEFEAMQNALITYIDQLDREFDTDSDAESALLKIELREESA